MKTPVVKAAKKNKDIRSAKEKELTLDSTKNHLKVFARYSLTLDQGPISV